ncbi:MAG: transporter associated domain-containing protein, partial [Thermomicrobiales bacterium]
PAYDPARCEALQPALFVPEISPVFTVIDQMRTSRQTMAILIDEYGGFDGIITFNDILSDIVGEIDDPAETNLRGAVARPDGSWLIDGVFPAHEFRDLFDIEELPGENAGRFESVGGFLMDQLGHVPKEGERLDWDGFGFEILDMDGNRIDKILVTPGGDPMMDVDV